MKTTIQILLLSFLLITGCSKKDLSDLENGVLWRIESKKGFESYIFGTIHLYPKSELVISHTTFSKLQNCKTLVLERDITNVTEQRKFADFQMPDFILESYRTIISEYGDRLVSMEGQLIQKAQESNINIAGLESADEILHAMNTLSTIKVPENTLNKIEMLVNFQKSLKMYNDESIGKLKDSLTIQMGEEVTKILVDERNENWIDDIESLINKNRSFIAVGAGHLGGKNGVLHLLREKGYKLESIGIENMPPEKP
ncbi:TraB/GumN family protein [Pricia sp.]|uniref:TraB/GumN family protein n=1 Tax=Pricia sp. TaxID=2268138 RepID=UPI0035939BFB